jgi:hypothetical protein
LLEFLALWRLPDSLYQLWFETFSLTLLHAFSVTSTLILNLSLFCQAASVFRNCSSFLHIVECLIGVSVVVSIYSCALYILDHNVVV